MPSLGNYRIQPCATRHLGLHVFEVARLGIASPKHVASTSTSRLQATIGPGRQPHGARGRGVAALAGAWDGPSTTSVSVNRYFGRGPYTGTQLPPIKIPTKGSSGPLECTLQVFVPQGGATGQQRWPLVVLSAGFLLHSGLYGSYASDLASWGLAVALYDLPELVDDVAMVANLGSIVDVCTSDPRVAPHVDPGAVLLAGHSRGGKLSVLAAAGDPRVRGLALLDPVDVTAMTPMGPGYPSALPAMSAACAPPRRLPVLVVGAGGNADIIPADANYRRFVSSCTGPCWSLELQGAGHLQFLDARVELLSMFVGSGPLSDEAVRAASKAAVLAWALELAVPLARGQPLSGPQVAERLQAAAAAIQQRMPVASSLKGFDQLGGSSGGQTQGSGAASAPRGSAREGPGGSGAQSSGSRAEGNGAGSRGGARASAGADAAPSAASSSSSSASGPSSSSPGDGRARAGGGSWNYEALMAMRARELKAILVERGVDCSDCFEKADLARRILERC